MFTEEDEYYDEELETYFMGTPSQARRRYNPPPNDSRPIYKNRYNPSRTQAPYYPMNRD